MATATDLGLRLRRLREATGLSARAFDEKAGVAIGLAAMLESGARRGIRVATAKKYAAACGCDWLWLLEGTGKPPRLKGRAA